MQSSLIDLYSVYGGSFNDRTSACNDHAAFSSGCGPYLVRMIHGERARPIQKDGTLQRYLPVLGGLEPAPTVGPSRRVGGGAARQALPHGMTMRLSPRAAART